MKLDLSDYHPFLKIVKKGKDRYIFDPIRKDYYVLGPEELVRQSWIQFLINNLNISSAALSVEKQIRIFDGVKRFDLVYFNKGKAEILFEFKSFNVNITDATCHQVSAYNFELKVPYIVISNEI